MMIQLILVLVVLALAFVLGLWIAKNTSGELVLGRKWFIILMVVSLIVSLIFVFLKRYDIVLTCLFIIIFTTVCYYKSFDKNNSGRI